MKKVLQFMSWNTRLYMQGNAVGKNREKIDWEKSNKILDIVKTHVDKNGGIAILQEVPYRINHDYDNNKKWDKHPIFETLERMFPETDYEVLYDNSIKYRILQTTVIAKKEIIRKVECEQNNSFLCFQVDDLNCLGVHSDNAVEIRQWLASMSLIPQIIAGDFNAGNYLLDDKEKDKKIAVNRQNFILLSEGYIDIFQGQTTTNYERVLEQRQIDHALIVNCNKFHGKYEVKDFRVDRNICCSDHFPLFWTIECKE